MTVKVGYGKKIKQAREAKGLSQTELGMRVINYLEEIYDMETRSADGLQKWICDLENEKNAAVNKFRLDAVADILNVSLFDYGE